MTTAPFNKALAFLFLFCAADVFPADDGVFKEAQDAVLGTLDLPRGISGQSSIHIRLKGSEKSKAAPSKSGTPLTVEMWEDEPTKKDFGERGTYELWNPKLRLRLSEGLPLSAADKLNGKTQILWQGDAVLLADAYRLLLNPDSLAGGTPQYKPWENPQSKFGPKGCLGFSVLKTAEGWHVTAIRRLTDAIEPQSDKVIALSSVQPSPPVSLYSEQECKAAFSQMICSQDAENLVVIERTVATAPSFINEDKYHEFHSPSLVFAEFPVTDAQALNGEVMASVRINCEAHRFPKSVRSKTAKTPTSPLQSTPMWAGEAPGKTWVPGPTSEEKGACDYIGFRKAGKWTFTTSDFLLNPVFLGRVVLLPKSEIPKPEDELPAAGSPAQRPFSGVGISLAPVGNVVAIASLTVGGPAEKTGQLNVGDRIIAIGDGDPPSIWGKIDLGGVSTEERAVRFSDVLKQLRGAAGTAVYLRIQPVGTSSPAQVKTVKIIRAVISPK